MIILIMMTMIIMMTVMIMMTKMMIMMIIMIKILMMMIAHQQELPVDGRHRHESQHWVPHCPCAKIFCQKYF